MHSFAQALQCVQVIVYVLSGHLWLWLELLPATTEEEDFFELFGITATAMPLRDAGLFICEHYVSICKEANIYVIIRKQLSGSKCHDVIYIYQTYIYILIFFYSLLKNNKTVSQ